ncbi:uncharacterized protein LOC131597794 [Vicia villosa]|uniref:uncharacterized protein LOC131597794 n=1 Tax=Vicia villosa TaxID=3911 RepID=UPI00273BAC69|nr:uncharacterized protein LOC131597794 [Vicia villosa]
MKVNELIGSLQTFEMGMCDNVEKKNKSIAFVSNTEEDSEESNGGSDENLTYDSSRRSKTEEKPNQGKGIQCHGYEGYGNIRVECPTYLKKQKKGLSVTWSDGDSDSESEEEYTKHFTALTSIYASDDDSSEDELTFDELAASYKELCVRSAEVCKQGEKQKKLIKELESKKKEHLATIDSLNCEISMLNSKLDQMSKSIRILNNGTDSLLYGYPSLTLQVRPKQNVPVKKQQWIAKTIALIAHTSIRVSAKEDRYFDSGCSKHMNGIKNLLVDIKPHSTSYVTFGDGAKGEIKGVGKLECLGVLKLDNVLLVKGLAANLISISQLCNQGFNVRFTKDECVVTNGENEEVMKRFRSKDNCYLWEPKTSSYSTI